MTTPTILYIVGNGFDLHHRLPTAFSDFRDDVRRRAPKVADLVGQWLPNAGDDWSSLESALGDFDDDLLIQDASMYLQSYGAEDWSDASHFAFQEAIEAVVEPLSSELSELFRIWVEAVPALTWEAAEASRIPLAPDAAFLSFNYTPTLATAYDIPTDRVWHVHGRVGTGAPLILGHGYKRRPLRTLPIGDEEDPIGDPREAQGFEIIDDYFRSTFKPADSIIAGRPDFFSRLAMVREVWVLGHAIGEVDWAYYRAIIEMLPPNAIWHASYYWEKPEEEAERVDALTRLGIGWDRIKTFTLRDLALSAPRPE
ncbi:MULTISPECIES: bacteriophage abortive infection AbiH family protein [unclassified Dyella]|uniref:bacteriophage abortive infection AbiH family protein n=1 Tax=Dyella sp. ASV21 TaxID=2795114 RepID=UPI0018EAD11C|nr:MULTISPECIES: bacteriophage abortive infection AbiH family protein [unclassified Dyella]